MNQQHISNLAKKWSSKFKCDWEDIAQEINLFYYTRLASGETLDIFEKNNEGALCKIMDFKLRGSSVCSVGGTGKRDGKKEDIDEPDFQIKDEAFCPDSKKEEIEKRFEFENMFANELDELDQLDSIIGNDLGQAFGFSGANGRAVLSDLRENIIKKAKKRFTAKQGKTKNFHGQPGSAEALNAEAMALH